MTTETDEYVTERPYLVAYFDQYNRPLAYTSHFTADHAETTGAAKLGREIGTGAIVARVDFYELNPETMTYFATGEQMEW